MDMGSEISPDPLDVYMVEAPGQHLKRARSASRPAQALVSSGQWQGVHRVVALVPSGPSTGKARGSMATKAVPASSSAGVSKPPLPSSDPGVGSSSACQPVEVNFRRTHRRGALHLKPPYSQC